MNGSLNSFVLYLPNSLIKQVETKSDVKFGREGLKTIQGNGVHLRVISFFSAPIDILFPH